MKIYHWKLALSSEPQIWKFHVVVWFAPKGVPHVQHDYFSSFNQSNQWFVALSSLLRSSFLKLSIVSIFWNTLGAWRKYDTFENNQEWFRGRKNEWYVDDRKYQFITKFMQRPLLSFLKTTFAKFACPGHIAYSPLFSLQKFKKFILLHIILT